MQCSKSINTCYSSNAIIIHYIYFQIQQQSNQQDYSYEKVKIKT